MAAVGEIAPTSTVPLERVSDDRHRRFAVWTIACATLTTVAVVVVSLVKTHGHIVYAIDDGGIHLSLARNLGLHGTWGVVPHHFQSASSSPLWTVLLVCSALGPAVLGIRVFAPAAERPRGGVAVGAARI